MNVPDKEVLVVKCGNRYLFLDLSSIHLVREKLSDIEKRLQNLNFVRISRSVVVNIKSIRELQHKRQCSIQVTLQNQQQFVMTRKYRQNLDLILGRHIGSARTCPKEA